MANERRNVGHITIDQLRVLIKVFEAGTFEIEGPSDRPRATINSTRTTLQRLAAAIGEPDTPLAEPTTWKRVRLTPRGEEVLLYAQSIIGLVDELCNKRPTVKVAAYSSFILQILQRVPNPYSMPFEFVPINSGRADGGRQLTQRLANHEIDIAIAPYGLMAPRLRQQWLYSWELRAVGQLPQAEVTTIAQLCKTDRASDDRPAIRLEDLAEHPLLVSPTGHRSRTILQAAADQIELPLHIQFELADHGLMRRLSKLTNWIAVMPSDAYDILNLTTGAAIVSKGNLLDGAYYIYWRAPLSKGMTDHEQRIDSSVQAIADLFRRTRPSATATS